MTIAYGLAARDRLRLWTAQHGREREGVSVSSVQSRRAKGGNHAEDLVEDLNAECAAAGVAHLWRVPTPTKVVGVGEARKGRCLQMVHTKRATVDFLGVMRDGRAVAVEVKRLEGRRLNLGRVEPQQRACLDLVADAGGVAVLLVVTPKEAYAVGWRHARAAQSSLGPDELGPWKLAAGRCYLAEF